MLKTIIRALKINCDGICSRIQFEEILMSDGGELKLLVLILIKEVLCREIRILFFFVGYAFRGQGFLRAATLFVKSAFKDLEDTFS